MASSLQTIHRLGAGVVDVAVGMTTGGRTGGLFVPVTATYCLTTGMTTGGQWRIQGAGWRPPIDLTNFCINVKSNPRMHQNPPFSGKNSIFSLPGPFPLFVPNV